GGLAWEEAAEQTIFKPLGMASTSARYSDFLTRDNRTSLHVLVDGNWTALVQRDPDPQAPAGGVSSSVRDLAQWLRLEINNGKFDGKQLIKEEAIAASHEPVIYRRQNKVTGATSFYGLGWTGEY